MSIVIKKQVIGFNDIDIELLNNFLEDTRNISYSEMKVKKSILLRAFNYIRKPINDIRMLDIYNYLKNVIDKGICQRRNKGQPFSIETKETHRAILRQFFNSIVKLNLEKCINYLNPVPRSDIFKFSLGSGDIINPLDEPLDIFTDEELLNVLQRAEKKKEKIFILIGLLIACGMRVGEVLTIKVENIHLKDRMLVTGFEEGAKKSTRRNKRALLFFFPKNFSPFLERYIIHLNNPKYGFLFPSTRKHNNSDHFSKSGLYGYVYKNLSMDYGKFHKYRRTLISRLDNTPGMQPHIREILLNHTPTTTQGKAYIKKEPLIKRRDYDRFFPYYHFPYY